MNQNQQSALQDVLELLHTNFSTYETAAEYQNTTKGRKTHEGDSPEKVRSKEFFLLHLNHFIYGFMGTLCAPPGALCLIV